MEDAEQLTPHMSNAQSYADGASQTSDDDRSSSLSELDDGPEAVIETVADMQREEILDDDSEAETERLEISPNKLARTSTNKVSSMLLSQDPLRTSTSLPLEDEAEMFSDSSISSPRTTDDEQLGDEASDNGGPDEVIEAVNPTTSKAFAGKKRKRMLIDHHSDDDNAADERLPRKRTGSIRSEEDRDLPDMADERSRSASTSRPAGTEAIDADETNEVDIPVGREDKVESDNENGSDQKTKQKGKKVAPHSRNSKSRLVESADDVEQVDEQAEADAQSGEEGVGAPDDVEDAEALAKNEEEQAKRAAAMDALLRMEKQFATLRDRLYDERIAALNNELAQLKGLHPTHPQLLQQVQAVDKYRDEKFEVEQMLLVFKVGALKRKSVAERSQLHSAYFQTVRDIRERHLEKASEFFYRVQRERFKTDDGVPNYSVPFPTKRSTQITQQTAYNKEVSVLSGVAKYVGFPTAPELAHATSAELDEDLEKMGVSQKSHSFPEANAKTSQISRDAVRASKAAQPASTKHGFMTALPRPAAENEFLQQTPWANPQHPIHHQYLQRAHRPASTQPKAPTSTETPAAQKAGSDVNTMGGSASTIPEQASAPISSTLNTPYIANDEGIRQTKSSTEDCKTTEPGISSTDGQLSSHRPSREEAASPSEARKAHSSKLFTSHPRSMPDGDNSYEPSPRPAMHNSPPRPSMSRNEYEPRRQTASPITFNQHSRENGVTARGASSIGAR